MTVQARPLASRLSYVASHLCVTAGEACDIQCEIYDSKTGEVFDWSGHDLRFRVYSQLIDRTVVLEISDPERCIFTQNGVWRLRMSADETASLPRGGMTFTLEHRNPLEHACSRHDYVIGVHGGISCYEKKPQGIRHRDVPRWRPRTIVGQKLVEPLAGSNTR